MLESLIIEISRYPPANIGSIKIYALFSLGFFQTTHSFDLALAGIQFCHCLNQYWIPLEGRSQKFFSEMEPMSLYPSMVPTPIQTSGVQILMSGNLKDCCLRFLKVCPLPTYRVSTHIYTHLFSLKQIHIQVATVWHSRLAVVLACESVELYIYISNIHQSDISGFKFSQLEMSKYTILRALQPSS
jgi:hypothetical protein